MIGEYIDNTLNQCVESLDVMVLKSFPGGHLLHCYCVQSAETGLWFLSDETGPDTGVFVPTAARCFVVPL